MADETTTQVTPEVAPVIDTPKTVEDFLSFDPFDGKTETGKVGDKAVPEETVKSEGGDGSKPAVAAQPQEPKTPEPTAKDPEFLLMQKQLKDATDLINTLKEQKATPQQEPATKQDAPQDTTPAYMFNFPDELVGKLNSEDPREVKEGLVAMSAGVARAIHQTVLKEVMEKVLPQAVQMSVGRVQATEAQTAEMQNIRTDFYGTYKEFDKPELRPIIGMIAANLAGELGVKGYSPEFREVLVQRVRSILGAAQPAAQPTPAAKPPAMTGGSGTRSGSPTPEVQLQREIMDLF